MKIKNYSNLLRDFTKMILIILIISFIGCKANTVLVPVKETRIEYRDKYRIDSIYNRDTIEMYKQNDTIYKNVIKWREKFVKDTINIVKIDSIPYKVEVVKEVNVLTKWQKIRLDILNILAVLILLYLAFKIGKVI